MTFFGHALEGRGRLLVASSAESRQACRGHRRVLDRRALAFLGGLGTLVST